MPDIIEQLTDGMWELEVISGAPGQDGTDGVGVPAGGSTGQVLAKINGTNYNTQWTTPHYVPAAGSDGQVLTKQSGTDYDAAWEDPAGGGADLSNATPLGPGTASPGDDLTASRGDHIHPRQTSVTPAEMNATAQSRLMPSGGSDGQVLAKQSGTDYDANWETPSGGSGVPAGGANREVLAKQSGADGDTDWRLLTAADDILDATRHVNTDGDVGRRLFVGSTTPTSPAEGDLWIDPTAEPDDLVIGDVDGLQDALGDLADFDADLRELAAGVNNTLNTTTPGFVSIDQTAADIQDFTSGGTWTKPAGATIVIVSAYAGGGGSGSGRRGAEGSARYGGSGGSGGGAIVAILPASACGSTETITIGAGGTAGAARSTNDQDGANGGQGGNTSFGTLVVARGGQLGVGGATATSVGDTDPVASAFVSGYGGYSLVVSGILSRNGGAGFTGGGGSGGWRNAANTNSTFAGNGGAATGGTGGSSGFGSVGAAGAAGVGGISGGSGGGGGTVGFAGGAGGFPGGGAGGGGAGINSTTNSGAGAVGGAGFLRAVTLR